MILKSASLPVHFDDCDTVRTNIQLCKGRGGRGEGACTNRGIVQALCDDRNKARCYTNHSRKLLTLASTTSNWSPCHYPPVFARAPHRTCRHLPNLPSTSNFHYFKNLTHAFLRGIHRFKAFFGSDRKFLTHSETFVTPSASFLFKYTFAVMFYELSLRGATTNQINKHQKPVPIFILP